MTFVANQDQFVLELHDLTVGKYRLVVQTTFTRVKVGGQPQDAEP